MAARLIFLFLTTSYAFPHPQGMGGHGHDAGNPEPVVPAGAAKLSQAMLKLMPISKAVKAEQMKPTIPMTGAKKMKLRYGPFKLNAAGSKDKFGNTPSMDPAGTAFNFRVQEVPTDISVLMAQSKVVMEDGTPADITKGIYNHHVAFADPAHSKPLMYSCGPGFKTDFMAAAATTTFAGGAEEAGAATFKSGFYIAKNNALTLSGDIVNYNNQSRTVYIDTEVEYVEGKPQGFLDTSLQMINLAQCEKDGNTFIKPPEGKKKFSLKGQDIRVIADGYFVFAEGHMHDGGSNLIIRINGKEVCTSIASYGGVGKSTTLADGKKWETLSNMTLCPAPIRIRKGDKISIEAFYDLENHPARAQHGGGMGEEMATLLAFFAPG